MEKQHRVGLQESLWPSGTFLQLAFPSVSALVVALFWALQALGRIVIGPIMSRVSANSVFVICSGLCCVTLIVSLFGSKTLALISLALVGLFTCASFTAIFSAAIQSFKKHHGTISGILCTAIVGGALGGMLVGVVGDAFDLRVGMLVNLVAFLYVFGLAIFGKGKLDLEP
jgi:fucose permease